MKKALDLYRDTLIELDKHESPSFEIEDFNYISNSALNFYVNENYIKFDVVQKDVDDIRSIVTLDQNLNFIANKANLPENYRHILNLDIQVKTLKNLGLYKKDEVFTLNRVQKLPSASKGYNQDNAYFIPSFKRPFYQISKNSIVIKAGNDVTVQSGKLDYIEIPGLIYLNPDKQSNYTLNENNSLIDFPIHVYYELIKIVTRMFLENTESPRYQTSMSEKQVNVN
jgi:hypothetical protein